MSVAADNQSDPPYQGISLQELSRAFAQAMGGQPHSPEQEAQAAGATQGPAEPPRAPEPATSPCTIEGVEPPLAQGEPGDDSDPCRVSPRTILEAMLFVGNRQGEPISSQRAAELMRGVKPEEIPSLVEELNARYQAHGCPYQVVSEGCGYRMALRRAFHGLQYKFFGRVREARLSQAAIDVLAIVAYRQPLTAEDVNRLRGTPSNHVLLQLLRRQLLRIERTQDKPRKPLYYTTDRFLGLFGLESLEDLPQSEELDKR